MSRTGFMGAIGGRVGFGMPSVTGFNPGVLPGLISWYRSDLGITTGHAIGSVSVWADQSGGGNNLVQFTASGQPLLIDNQLNGYPCVRFDGINDEMLTNSFSSLYPYSIFIVFKLNALVDYAAIFTGDSFPAGYLSVYPAAGGGGLFSNNGGVLQNPDFTPFQYCLVTAIFDGVNSSLQTGNGTEAIGNAGTNTISKFSLGGSYTVSNLSQIDVCDIVIVDHAATVDEIDNVKDYVLARYGI